MAVMAPLTQRAVIVYGTDRAWRLACDAELRARGVRARLASRPAEVVKCLRDTDGALVVVDGTLPPGGSVSGTVVVRREGSEPGVATIQRVVSQLADHAHVR